MQLELEIVMKPVNEIIPYWRNPRRNDKTVEELVKTIPATGFNVPIVIDKNNVVVKGHARLKAAKRLGMVEVPCIVSDASEDVIKADRITDNKIQELSAWDFSKLNLELDTLGDKMTFSTLFRPEESPRIDEPLLEIQFKPTGISLDGDYAENEETVEYAAMPHYSDNTSVFESKEYKDTRQAENTAVGQKIASQRKALKTLCPYCGKVVVLNV